MVMFINYFIIIILIYLLIWFSSHLPESKECQDELDEINKNKVMFEDDFYNETSIIMDEFLA